MSDKQSNGQFPAFGKFRSGAKSHEKLDIDEFIPLVSNETDRKILRNYKRTYKPGSDPHINNPDDTADEVEKSEVFIDMLSEALNQSNAVAFENGARAYLEALIGTDSDADMSLDENTVELIDWYETVTDRNDETNKVGTNGLSKKYIIGGETRTGKNHTGNKFFIEYAIVKYGKNNISICTNQKQLANLYDFVVYCKNEQEILDWAENTYKKYMGVILDEMDDPGRLGVRNSYEVEQNWIPVYNMLGKNGVQAVVIITHRFNAIARTVRGADAGTEADFYLYKPSKDNRGRVEIYNNYDEETGLHNYHKTFENLSKCGLKMDSLEAGYFTLTDADDSNKDDSEAIKEEMLSVESCKQCGIKAEQYQNAPINWVLESGYCKNHIPEDELEKLKDEIGL